MLKRIGLVTAAVTLLLGVTTGAAFAAPADHKDGSESAAQEDHGNGRAAAAHENHGPDSEPAAQENHGQGGASAPADHKDTSACDGDPSGRSDSGHGANQGGPYDNTCPDGQSANGNGNGNATGRPCAGCVGNADDKNPGAESDKGQMPNGSDHNAGYECDRNHGIGRGNPAHTGCQPSDEGDEGTVDNGSDNGGSTGGSDQGGSTEGEESGSTGSESTQESSEVLGEAVQNPAPVSEVQVLGVKLVAAPKASEVQVLGEKLVAGQPLPKTGTSETSMLYLGFILLATGTLMVRISKRQSS